MLKGQFISVKTFTVALFVFVGVTAAANSQDILSLARSGDVEGLRLALPFDSKTDPEALVRPIYFAAQRGHTDVVAYLLSTGAPPDAMTKFGSALQIAARNNHAEIVSLLLERGADPNIRGGDFGNAPIHDAAERGAMDAARVLLDHGADVNFRRSTGEQPAIHLAVRKERDEMVAFLLENGARPLPTQLVAQSEFDAIDPEVGRARAEECLFCHSLDAGEMPSTKFAGPDLAGFVGREIAVRDYFAYSSPLKAESGTWTIDRLNSFIADPTGVVPGTSMERGRVSNRVERIAVIKYLMNGSSSQ